MIKFIITALIIFSLAGCMKSPQENKQSTNPNFELALLFKVDGYKVYRFEDGGRSRYFVIPENANGKVSGTSWDELHGKITVQEDIQTINK